MFLVLRITPKSRAKVCAAEDVHKPPGSLLLTVLKRGCWCNSYLMSGVGVSCRILYSFVGYLYVNGGGSITSVGEKGANLSAIIYL